MPIDPTTLPDPHAERPPGGFAVSAAVGLGVPVVAGLFGGLAGELGFLTALVVLTVAAIAARPSVERFFGVVTGVVAAFFLFFGLLALTLRDL